MLEVFIDQQSLGIRNYLEAVGIKVRDDSEIRGSKDTSKSVSDEQVLVEVVVVLIETEVVEVVVNELD